MTRRAMGLHLQGGGANGLAAAYIRAVRPSMVKWIDHADPALVELANSVGAITVLRVYEPDQRLDRVSDYLARVEQAILANPGIQAFEVSYNEAHQDGADIAAKAQADILGMKLCERHRKRAVIGSFSVGMPGTPEEPDHSPAWALYRPALEYAAKGGHYLGKHEYGGGSPGMRLMVEGDGKAARGLAFLRYRRVLDWAKRVGLKMPKILITECGIDFLAQADLPTRGWRTMPAGYDYAADLRWAAERLTEDHEAVAGWCDFGWASEDPEWHPFDLSRDSAVLERVISLQASLPDAPAAPRPAPAQPPKEPAMPDLGAMLAAEFGALYSDMRGSLPRNPGGPAGDFSRRALGQIEMLAVHHTAADRAQSWQAIAQAHVTGRGWAGIGYHIGIRLGQVAYLGDASLSRACCADQNHRVLCVCLTGNYETGQVDKADEEALRRVVVVVQRWSQAVLGWPLKVLGHKEVPGQATACPGRNLLPLVHQLAAGGAAAPAPAPNAAALLSEADRLQTVRLNPASALQRAIARDGFVPTSDEFKHQGVVAQRAERLTDGTVRVYYVRPGDWHDVHWAERKAA